MPERDLAKRKRGLHNVGSARQKPKRRRKDQVVSTDYSEATDSDYENDITVFVPPPKSSMQTSKYLTFPMGPSPRPLPDCEGPKLKPFSHGDVRVRFIRELGTNAVHSNVFEVEIQGKPYALKVFRTFSASYFPKLEKWSQDARPRPKDLANYFRPFYRECRAYGCINESKVLHRYWRCYGYLKLPSHLRDELCKITGFPHHYWQVRPPEFGRFDKPTDTRSGELSWPIYAVVKELAPFPSAAIDPKQRGIRSMKADLRHLHKIGVINSDIADRNYIAGRFIDFSSSFTLPNLWFTRFEGSRQTYYPDTFKDGVSHDVLEFNYMIRVSGIKTTAVLPDGPRDGWISTRTRSSRGAWVNFNHLNPKPFYELGINEPHSPKPRSSVTILSTPS